MNEETKAAPSQSAWARGCKFLLHQYTGLPLDSSLFQACLCGNSAEVLELAVWAVTFPQYLGFHCLSSLCPSYLRYWRIEFICFLPSACYDSVSTGWESISFPVEVSLAYEPLLWSFISVFASLITTNKIQRWQDLCEARWGEKMNKDEDSSF